MKKRMSKLVIALNCIAGIVFLFSLCAIDSDTNLFYITAIISFAWLAFISYKYGYLGGDSYDVD